MRVSGEISKVLATLGGASWVSCFGCVLQPCNKRKMNAGQISVNNVFIRLSMFNNFG